MKIPSIGHSAASLINSTSNETTAKKIQHKSFSNLFCNLRQLKSSATLHMLFMKPVHPVVGMKHGGGMAGTARRHASERFGVFARLKDTFSILVRRPIFFSSFLVANVAILVLLAGLATLFARAPLMTNAYRPETITMILGFYGIVVFPLVQILLAGALTAAAYDVRGRARRSILAYAKLALRRLLSLGLVLFIVLMLIGFAQLAFFVVSLWVMAVYTPVLPVVVVEGAGLRAIGRAASLSTGYRWAIVGHNTLLILSTTVVIVLVAKAALRLEDTTQSWLLPVLLLFGLSLVTLVTCAGSVSVYSRLLAIKESLTESKVEDVFG